MIRGLINCPHFVAIGAFYGAIVYANKKKGSEVGDIRIRLAMSF
jgi:hypothetical protein